MDKNLSGEEKRRKLKEEYKKDLLARKQFRQKVNRLKNLQKINKALENMVTDNDDTDDWIRKLDEETALNEAKVEISLDSILNETEEKQKKIVDEAEMKKINAKNLVEEMKKSLGLFEEEETTEEEEVSTETTEEEDEKEEEVSIDLPEEETEADDNDDDIFSPPKTLGDF